MEGPRGLAARAPAPPFAAAEAAADARGAWAREFGRGGGAGDGWVGRFRRRASPSHAAANAVSSAAAAAAAARSPAGPQTWAEEYSGVKQSSGGAWSMGSGEARTGASGATRPGDAWRASSRANGEPGRDVGARGVVRVRAGRRRRRRRRSPADWRRRSRRPGCEVSLESIFTIRLADVPGRDCRRGRRCQGGAAPEPSAAHRSTGAAWADEFAAAARRTGRVRRVLRRGDRRDGRNRLGKIPASASAAPASSDRAAILARTRWADEFADVPDQWAREFEEMRRDGGDWAHESVWDQIAAETAAVARRSVRGTMSSIPTRIWAERIEEVGRDLFRRGVLSEAALALEAAVRADPDLCEGWRLLGTVHAENDDDRRAFAAMTRANEADPNDPGCSSPSASRTPTSWTRRRR